jgi:HSP20 family protein
MTMPPQAPPFLGIMGFPPGFEEGPFGGPGRRHGESRGGHPCRGRHHPGFVPQDLQDPLSHGHGRGGMFGSRGHHHGPHGHHGHHRGMHRGRGGRGGRGGMPGPFDFSFLENFAAEMDPANAWFGPRDGRGRHQSDNPVDFVPRADVFNAPTEYVVHVSLPGANKADVSVDYDPEESTLRLSGVIHRPEFSEELHRAIVIEERQYEVGVFERNIPLGTREAPASIDNEKISAKFVDGILVVRLPKNQNNPVQFHKKVYIEGDGSDNVEKEAEPETSYVNEKHASVLDVADETDTMHLDTDTEPGDLLKEVDEHSSYTPSHDSEEEDLYDIVKSKDNIKVNVE